MVALGALPRGDHLRQWLALEPLGDDHVGGRSEHVSNGEVGVALEGRRKGALRLALGQVVEFLDHPLLKFGDERLDIEAGRQVGEEAGEAHRITEVGHEGLSRAGVLDLHGDLAAVAPHRPVHLADGGRRGGRVVEVGKALAPVLAELVGQHSVHGGGGQRRRGVLQFGEGGAVGAGHLLGQGSLEDTHRLAHLHGPTLELAQHLEQLLGGASLNLGADRLGGLSSNALTHA
ncbi:unannotated protein [freshwater metagenome]|uniref:Unannotated protein n=1 Tax=freshwater metagenome TaxID=449393 RepID=A0A6J7L904_9ZZZZ